MYIGVRADSHCAFVNWCKINGQRGMLLTDGFRIGLASGKESRSAFPKECPIELCANQDAERGDVEPDQRGNPRAE